MSRWTGTDSCLSLTGKQGLTGEGCGGQVQNPKFSMRWAEEPLDQGHFGWWMFTWASANTGEGLTRETLWGLLSKPDWGWESVGLKTVEDWNNAPSTGSIQHGFCFFFYFPCVPWGLLQTRKGLDAPQYGYSYVLVYMGLNQHRIKIYRAKIYPSCKVPTIKQ